MKLQNRKVITVTGIIHYSYNNNCENETTFISQWDMKTIDNFNNSIKCLYYTDISNEYLIAIYAQPLNIWITNSTLIPDLSLFKYNNSYSTIMLYNNNNKSNLIDKQFINSCNKYKLNILIIVINILPIFLFIFSNS